MNMTKLADRSLIGRTREIAVISSSIRNGKSLHIYGEPGAGKSTLLDWAFDNWELIGCSLAPIYCRNSRTLREIVLQISASLGQRLGTLRSTDKFGRKREFRCYDELKSAAIPALKQIVFCNIQKDGFLVLLDHLEQVTPKIYSLVSSLNERVPVITASRQSWEISDYAFRGSLAYHSFYLTPKLHVENLSRQNSVTLMKRHIAAGDSIADDEILEKIYSISKGNPRLMSQIISKTMLSEYRTEERINLKLIMLDLRIEELGEIHLDGIHANRFGC